MERGATRATASTRSPAHGTATGPTSRQAPAAWSFRGSSAERLDVLGSDLSLGRPDARHSERGGGQLCSMVLDVMLAA